MLTTEDIKKFVNDDRVDLYYNSRTWRNLRSEVLKEDKYECQFCKAEKKYTRATMVHHVKHLKEHPELALSKHFYDDFGQKHRQLISACENCHETKGHPERLKQYQQKEPITPERW